MILNKPFSATVGLFLLQCCLTFFLSAAQFQPRPPQREPGEEITVDLPICLQSCLSSSVQAVLDFREFTWVISEILEIPQQQVTENSLFSLGIEAIEQSCLSCGMNRKLQGDPGGSGLASIKLKFTFLKNDNQSEFLANQISLARRQQIENTLRESTDEINRVLEEMGLDGNALLGTGDRSTKKSKSNKKKKKNAKKKSKSDKKGKKGPKNNIGEEENNLGSSCLCEDRCCNWRGFCFVTTPVAGWSPFCVP